MSVQAFLKPSSNGFCVLPIQSKIEDKRRQAELKYSRFRLLRVPSGLGGQVSLVFATRLLSAPEQRLL